MLRVESKNHLIFTEFEEDISFDIDDPDFDHGIHLPMFQMPSSMSLADIYPADFHSSHGSLLSLSHSLDDLVGLGAVDWHLHHQDGQRRRHQQDHVLTIEQLRLEMTTCFTCGVSWNDDHVSLDCSECGGYAHERPCLDCDGKCAAKWKRDLSLSHSSGKARWQGECQLRKDQKQSPHVQQIESDLTQRLEKLSANS